MLSVGGKNQKKITDGESNLEVLVTTKITPKSFIIETEKVINGLKRLKK